MTLHGTTADNYRTLPQIPRADVTLLWHSDFWDGPLSGLLLWCGERVWFQMIAENDEHEGWYRRFVLVSPFKAVGVHYKQAVYTREDVSCARSPLC